MTRPAPTRKRPPALSEPGPAAPANPFPSRQEAVAAALRLDILRGQLGAGTRLDIDEIAARHGVSRTPVRDALKQLEAEGLVQVLPYRGVEVTSLGDDDLRELFAIRIALERLAVAQAVHTITDAEIEGLRRILRRMDRISSRDDSWTTLNIAFHDGIHTATRWPRLIEMIRIQRTNVERCVRARASALGIARQQAEHWSLLEALARRDPTEAERVIAQHLRQTLEALCGPAEGAGPA
jgi:DNA-binding GntR family transcriptional regulator